MFRRFAAECREETMAMLFSGLQGLAGSKQELWQGGNVDDLINKLTQNSSSRKKTLNESDAEAIALKPSELWNPTVQVGPSTRAASAVAHKTTTEQYPELEILRHECLRTLRARYTKLCENINVTLPPDAFERWQFRSTLTNKGPDPLIPDSAGGDQDFIETIEKAGASVEDATALDEALAKFSTKASHTMYRRVTRLGRSKKIKCSLEGNMFTLTCGNSSLVITQQHYDKLKTLHGVLGGGYLCLPSLSSTSPSPITQCNHSVQSLSPIIYTIHSVQSLSAITQRNHSVQSFIPITECNHKVQSLCLHG
jgi:hypothetical protein